MDGVGVGPIYVFLSNRVNLWLANGWESWLMIRQGGGIYLELLSYLGLLYFCCTVLWVLAMFLHLLDVSLSFCFV